MKKMNENSKLGWWDTNYLSGLPFSFEFIELTKDMQIRKKMILTENSLSHEFNFKCQLNIDFLKETKLNEYLCCTSGVLKKGYLHCFKIEIPK